MQDAKRRAIIFTVISVVLAGMAGILFLQEVNAVQGQLGGMRTVYVAARPINELTPLRPDFFKEEQIPEAYYEKIKSSVVQNINQVQGKVSVIALKEGELLTNNVLRMATDLTDSNHRLVQLSASERVGFDVPLTAQDKVDILITVSKDDKNGTTTVEWKGVPVWQVADKQKAIWVELPLDDAAKLINYQNFATSIRVLKAPQNEQPSFSSGGEEGDGDGESPQTGSDKSGKQTQGKQAKR
ncbi:flp pilus assembly protein CpaB [Polycladomyces sp. WAk]|uniref:Flp pilus assembly protein CpaB n=1 Tax=Polycladomyces zharkentensis TaxID=2807616 RepID=A0ABS2WM70_9BACL|nr:SAF domain-containing protein [Polycladomyces sp. WAk]MBN2910624.1 flp pilus assembly protein CpaB [Polycladomyces sp. WAk]